MTVYVQTTRAAAREPEISPELVLVDPELATVARARLANRPGGGLPPPAAPVRSSPPLQTAACSRGEIDERRTEASRRALLAVAVATMLVVLLLDVRVEVGQRSAAAERDASETSAQETAQTAAADAPSTLSAGKAQRPAATPPSGGTRGRASGDDKASRPGRRGSAPPTRADAASPRRFAWAPAARADGYYVEFFRGSTRVFAKRTTRPMLDVPALWRYQGTQRSFVAGTYRWYVWPLVDGKRTSRAAVQTTISIPTD